MLRGDLFSSEINVKLGLKPKTVDEDSVVVALLDCHARIREFFTMAMAAGQRSEAGEELIKDAIQRVHRYFTLALPLHVQDEEESISPRMRGISDAVDRALDQMSAEHKTHMKLIDALVSACEVALASENIAKSAKEQVLPAALVANGAMMAHLDLEEGVLFPVLDKLELSVQKQIRLEMKQRRAS